MKRFKVEKQQKLIDFLAEKLKISKKRSKRLIDTKNVFVNNKRIWIASFDLSKGDIVEVPEFDFDKANHIHILYEDDFIIAVNKPPFVVSDKEKNSVESILKKHKTKQIKAIHRLDKETSGILLFAKNFNIYERFKNIWNEKNVQKSYYAVSHYRAGFKQKTLNTKISGKKAISIIKTLKTSKNYTVFLVHPVTGRKHQIRIHLSSIGHPIVGDKIYGLKNINYIEKSVKRHLLHSKHMKFFHPFLKKFVQLKAPVPEDIKDFVKKHIGFNLE